VVLWTGACVRTPVLANYRDRHSGWMARADLEPLGTLSAMSACMDECMHGHMLTRVGRFPDVAPRTRAPAWSKCCGGLHSRLCLCSTCGWSAAGGSAAQALCAGLVCARAELMCVQTRQPRVQLLATYGLHCAPCSCPWLAALHGLQDLD